MKRISDFLKGLSVFGLAFSISASAVPLLSHPVLAAQDRDGSGRDDFQERIYTFDEIHEMADYSGFRDLPDGQEYEIFYKRSEGDGFSTRNSVHGGIWYLNMKEGYQLSYEFLVDDGEKEVRVDGGIFEPLYYQIDVEKPSSPSEAFQFRKNESQGTKIMYDLPQNYSCRGKNGKEIEVRRIFKITSLETGNEVTVNEAPVHVKALGESLSTDTVTYKVRKGDSLWNIAKRQLGDPLKWDTIYQLNSDSVKNPDLIYEGQKLDIPKG